MIFDIYEQKDLFLIARCGRKSTLERWLKINMIPFAYNAKLEVLAHKDAVDAGLGAPSRVHQEAPAEVQLCFDTPEKPRK